MKYIGISQEISFFSTYLYCSCSVVILNFPEQTFHILWSFSLLNQEQLHLLKKNPYLVFYSSIATSDILR